MFCIAKQFYDRFSTEQDAYRDVELRSLAIVETTEHIQTVEIARMFRYMMERTIA